MAETRRTYFFWNKSSFEEAMRRRVCPACECWRDGVCRIPDPPGCVLFKHLSELVMIAQHMKHRKPRVYERLVRDNVRMQCANPCPEKACPFHDTLDCDFKKFLPLVLSAVEEADAFLEKECPLRREARKTCAL